ncbi:kinesin-like protein KIF6 isoform X2 [Littorina saxatilis]|uniref:kinesin-like protein KIF6 isoform X2 n=1 Tax=Littorina saxatilis TaxID=31220 RepID=UPI0038B53911
MVKQTIKIFVRLKPAKPAKTGLYEVADDEEGHPKLTLTVPREHASGFVNNKRENYKFRFDKCFDQRTSQDDVFQSVAKPVIDNVLQGYNGTIFAYGQTGSGKTFTITGGAERFVDRGLIPRCLSYVYDQTEQNPELSFTVHISYLEIYNESGYDLLDPKHEAAKLEDLPKVTLMEDADQNIHLKNLSVHQANTEEEALNLLFLGDTNRMIAETPMNMASSRSHCIFTVHITARETGSATIRRAKFHLVDLAGSERVAKTNVNGQLLTEARYINSSLHYLELVILALSEKSRQHVPYRNSMMTSVLRDSLGGNCMTTMIATCSLEKRNMDESISTCRFAQRVAMIKNDVLLNEELDPKMMIAKLQRTVQELRQELAMLTSEQRTDELEQDEMQWLDEAIQVFIEDAEPDPLLNVGADMRKIHYCFRKMRRKILERPQAPQRQATPPRPESPPDVGPYSNTENKRLKDLLQQRDNEINILVNMLKKERQKVADGGRAPRSARGQSNGHFSAQEADRRYDSQPERPTSDTYIQQTSQKHTSALLDNDDRMKTKILGNMSMGRQEAFDIFIQDYAHQQGINENKLILKQRYKQAKVLGEQLNSAKQKINHLKGQAAQLRVQGGYSEEQIEEMEHSLREDMEQEKRNYKEAFVGLRTMKTEIEHLQHLLENAKVKMMKDFEMWWAQQSAQNQAPNAQGGIRNAWNTPPITPPSRSGVPVTPTSSSSQRNYSQDFMREGDIAEPRIMDGRPPSGSRRTMAANLGKSARDGTFTMNAGKQNGGGDIPLTGDAEADADIMAFMTARQKVLQMQGKR